MTTKLFPDQDGKLAATTNSPSRSYPSPNSRDTFGEDIKRKYMQDSEDSDEGTESVSNTQRTPVKPRLGCVLKMSLFCLVA